MVSGAGSGGWTLPSPCLGSSSRWITKCSAGCRVIIIIIVIIIINNKGGGGGVYSNYQKTGERERGRMREVPSGCGSFPRGGARKGANSHARVPSPEAHVRLRATFGVPPRARSGASPSPGYARTAAHAQRAEKAKTCKVVALGILTPIDFVASIVRIPPIPHTHLISFSCFVYWFQEEHFPPQPKTATLIISNGLIGWLLLLLLRRGNARTSGTKNPSAHISSVNNLAHCLVG